jgi:hypothetical protein
MSTLPPSLARRLAVEKVVLARTFPRFTVDEANRAVTGVLSSNAGLNYSLRIEVDDTYPDTVPSVYVTWPQLKQQDGTPLADLGPTSRMHILGGRGGAVQLCHSQGAKWSVSDTLHRVLIKARVWLEAYELHHQTGLSIDRFLRHQ